MLPAAARIAVVSPSGNFDARRLDLGLALLREWGYRPEMLPGVGSRYRYLAGTDAERLAGLSTALGGGWDAVWAARGGYGIARLLPDLPWDALGPAADATPFFGFSDATPLLGALAARGRPAVHAPVLHSLGDLIDTPSRDHLRALLAGAPIPALYGRSLAPGVAEGPIAGGNLCMLASMCGTPWQLRAAGAIVVLEDLGEAPYKVDRLLTQLMQAGAFDGVAGFALGTFLDAAPPPDARWTLADVFTERLAPLGVPVLAELPIGHGPANRAFRVGAAARISGGCLEIGA